MFTISLYIMAVVIEANFLHPINPTLNEELSKWTQSIRLMVIKEVVLSISSRGLASPPRTEVIGTILPVKDVSQLDAIPTRIPAHSSPVLPDSPASPASPASPTSSLSPSPSPSSPILDGDRTAWETLCQKYPEMPTTPDPSILGSSARFLVNLPSHRSLDDNPRKRRIFSVRRRSNIKAALVQIAGVYHPPTSACIQCCKGRGIWTGCVTTPPQQNGALKGACANCFYNGTGSKCSFTSSKPFYY
ncbi:hypothetical protein F4679DRAFT_540183 [Xylaria curta]|nr:hypothetical protein F4679DRAFT_540183 [Xylaria curta]